MDDRSNQANAVELLQQLGLKEYEARSFVSLCRQKHGTAKDVSETSDVPRTRVYDAIRVLEEKGLVETQHSNPQVFRAVPIDEAVETLRTEYVQRTESLKQALEGLDPVTPDSPTDVTHEVWTISGNTGITSRTAQLIENADTEILFVIGHADVFTHRLADRLRAAQDRGVDIILGAKTDEERAVLQDAIPDSDVFVTGLDWLSASDLPGDETEISRLVMTDHEAILVSSFTDDDAGRSHERGVFGSGFDNGLVAIVRRLMTTGLLLGDDPAKNVS